MDNSVLSFLTPLFAIIMALITRNVLVSLIVGSFIGELVLTHFNVYESLSSIIVRIYSLISQIWILKTLVFALLVGSIVRLLEKSNVLETLTYTLQERYKIITNERRALFLAYFIGIIIFVESSITSLMAGTITKPFVDKFHVSRAKLAYVCDSTSAPICSIILFNGWGALLLGLISTSIQNDVESLDILLESIKYNFYAFYTLAVTFIVIYFSLYTSSMQNSKIAKSDMSITSSKNYVPLSYLFVPLFVLMSSVIFIIYLSGSGSSAIFYGVILTLVSMLVLYRHSMSVKSYINHAYKGANTMLPIVIILFLAFYIGDVTSDLKTGLYLSKLMNGSISVRFIPAIIFIIAAMISFATGTSWGTFSIMTPIAFALANEMDLDVAICMGALISGGVFGDHSSLISDTSIISAMASGCETVEHVKTQLPYAIVSAILAFSTFVLIS